MKVIPGIGLGPLRFGMSESTVRDMLGPPEEEAVFDDVDRHLYYMSRGMSLFFNADDGGRLSSIEVDSSCRCSLFGEPLFPKSRGQILELLHRNLPPAAVAAIKEEKSESLEQIYLGVRSLGTDFYFDFDDNLEQLLWGPLVGSDDEVVWPDDSDAVE